MSFTEKPYCGRHPARADVLAYYLRQEIGSAILRYARVRDVSLVWRRKGPRQPERAIAITPDMALTTFRTTVERVFCDTAQDGDSWIYPWFDASTTAYVIHPSTGERSACFQDIGMEYDYNWLRSFQDMQPEIDMLEAFGVPYRMKFSGHHSLHLVVPGEYFAGLDADRYGCTPDHPGELLHAFRSRVTAGRKRHSGNSVPYTVHRESGLVARPLLVGDLAGFRPWQCSIPLLQDVDGEEWYTLPAGGGERLQALFDWLLEGHGWADLPARRQVFHSRLPQSTAHAVAQELVGVEPDAALARLAQGAVQERRQAAWQLARLAELGCPLPAGALQQASNTDDGEMVWHLVEAMDAAVSDTEVRITMCRQALGQDEYATAAAAQLLLRAGPRGMAALLQAIAAAGGWLAADLQWLLQRRATDDPAALREAIDLYLMQAPTTASTLICSLLGRLGEHGTERLAQLLGQPPFQRSAAIALLRMGERGQCTLEALARQPAHPSHAYVTRLAERLVALPNGGTQSLTRQFMIMVAVGDFAGEGVADISRQLAGQSIERALPVLQRLAALGEDGILLLADCLAGENRQLARRAGEILFGMDVPLADDALLQQLEHDDARVRLLAALTARRRRDRGEELALPQDLPAEVICCIESEDAASTRWLPDLFHVARSQRRMAMLETAPEAEMMLPILLAALGDSWSSIRRDALLKFNVLFPRLTTDARARVLAAVRALLGLTTTSALEDPSQVTVNITAIRFLACWGTEDDLQALAILATIQPDERYREATTIALRNRQGRELKA